MMWGTLLAIPWRVLARTSPANTNGELEQTKSQLSLDVQRVQFTRSTGWVWRTFCSELTAVVSFIPCFYFLFLTVVAAAITGLFNISRSERVHQDPSPGVERNVTATKRVPRLFMVVPKTKHGSPANKEAHSAAVPAEEVDGKKRKPHKPKVLARQHNNYARPGYGNALGYAEAFRNGPQRLFTNW